jgi:hypothetical protein
MMRGQRPPRFYVQRDIQILVRSFPSERLQVFRLGEPRTSGATLDLGEVTYPEVTVFNGEALFIPAGGTVARYGLGEVEEDTPQVLIPGWHDIQQGDRVRRQQMLPGGRFSEPRLYVVMYAPMLGTASRTSS